MIWRPEFRPVAPNRRHTSSQDIKAHAAALAAADIFYEVPGGPNFNNYANVNVIISVAKLFQADAVWPGWGHASENPALPRTLAEARFPTGLRNEAPQPCPCVGGEGCRGGAGTICAIDRKKTKQKTF